jgi:hypothetical protein
MSPAVVVAFDIGCPGDGATAPDNGISDAAGTVRANVIDMNAISAMQQRMYLFFMAASPISFLVFAYGAMHENLNNFRDILFQFLFLHSGSASHDLLGPEIRKQCP